jgi:hypothetical protein
MGLPVIGMIVSTAFSAMGAIQQANAQAAQQRAIAQAQNYNAQVARNNAQIARDQANVAEENQRRKFNALQGEALAGIAQSGTGFFGSNLDVLKQNEVNNELDALTIRYQGETKSNALLAESQLDKYNADVANSNASSATTGGYFNAGAGLLSGVSRYYNYTKTGLV